MRSREREKPEVVGSREQAAHHSGHSDEVDRHSDYVEGEEPYVSLRAVALYGGLLGKIPVGRVAHEDLEGELCAVEVVPAEARTARTCAVSGGLPG